MSIILKTNKELIKNFTIFAERHSGTNFLEKWITKSFYIPVTWKYKWKHFFIKQDATYLKNKNTLFIGLVRNPYDWISAMLKIPYHIINISSNTTLIEFMKMPIVSQGSNNQLLETEYSDIFSLREIKNQYLLNTMHNISNNYLLINYENLLSIDTIFNELISSFTFSNYQFVSNNHHQNNYHLDKSQIDFINNKLNWQTENKLGYYAKN